MSRWYDLFSFSYDLSVGHLYEPARQRAAECLQLSPGDVVLDAPCGTGLSFPHLAAPLQGDGRLLGVDRSGGMLSRAHARASELGGLETSLIQGDLLEVLPQLPPLDGVHVFLGLTAMPRYEEVVAGLYDKLVAGRRFVIVDVYAEKLSLQGRMVQCTAQANLRLRAWEALEACGANVTFEPLESSWQVGGQLYCAWATK